MKWPFSKFFSLEKSAEANGHEMLVRFFEDESFQSGTISEVSREKFMSGESVDEVPTSFGEFGLTLTNPIPVNGAMGEVAYLSSLRHLGKTNILFHRLGSLDYIDIYE